MARRRRRLSGAGPVTLAVAVLAAVVVIAVGVPRLANPAVPRAGQAVGYAPPSSTPTRHVALMWGDSYFNGGHNGVSVDQTFASIAAQDLGYTPVVRGHGGTGFVQPWAPSNTPDYAGQIKAGGLRGVSDPALVVVEGGINDELSPPAEITAHAVTVLREFKARYPKATVLVMGPVDYLATDAAPFRQTDAAVKAAASRAGLPFIDAASWVTPATRAQTIGADNGHPSMAGNQRLARLLEAAIKHAS